MSKFTINRNGGFFVIDVNAILTLQLRPRYGHFDLSSWTLKARDFTLYPES